MTRIQFFLTCKLVLIGMIASGLALGQSDGDSLPRLPKLDREYRGVWVATVANIDWPSKPGLSPETQQAEATAILDKIAELRMNIVILQVRTSCDSLYSSSLEPWSYFLTGKQGAAPEPFYDPLEFWVAQAHHRGLELHAWFNPFRAKNSGQTYDENESHISKTKSHLVKKYGHDKTSYLWLDPGEPEARAHSLSVFMDVVRRYDIDGIHIDDYFYPYPVEEIPFPDDPAWEAYVASDGKLARDDWRRQSINEFIQLLYAEIKQAKPHVKFGISPFGIWKPGYPESVAGFSQYDKLYADAKLWWNQGWCDYYTPQLYWSITAKKQSFPALLAWWSEENTKRRHLAPGLFTSRIGDKNRPYSPEQIESQVFTSRHMPGGYGAIHFSMKALMENREGICDRLKDNAYSDLALVPACDWLDCPRLQAPRVHIEKDKSQATVVKWDVPQRELARRWVVQTLYDSTWKGTIVGRNQTSLTLPNDKDIAPRAVAVIAIDGAGSESPATILTLPSE